MKCPRCGGNNFKWAKHCDHCFHPFIAPKLSGDPRADNSRILPPTGASISLAPATSEQIDAFRVCWPFGLQDWPGANGTHGLICRKADREVMAVKFQQVDVAVHSARAVCFQNRALIALALRGYLAHGHRGLIMPCAYLRPKEGDRAETGIAYLVGPHPEFRPVSRHEFGDRWDEALGTSTATMLFDFAREVGRVIDQAPRGTSADGSTSIGRPIFLSMELRPVSTLGNLDSRIAVLGPDVLVTMPNPGSNVDSAWEFVAEAGFTSLAHLPIAPVELQANGSLGAL